MTTTVICGYSLSGGYGPIPRFLYYILLIVSIIFHKTEWLVGSTLGASMIFGSIAAVHAVALASARGRGTVDLGIIPVFSITGVGMVISVPLLMWSKALREAKRPIRTITFLWIMIMSIGVITSLASLAKFPTPLDCRDQSMAGCPLICETPLPMRDGQPILVVPFVASDLYVYWWTVVYPGLGFPLTISGLMMAQRRKHPVQQARDAFKANHGLTPRMRRKFSNNTMFCTVCAPPLSVGLAVAHVVLMELIQNRPRSIPLGENMTAIGQWGSLVGAALALIASIMEWKLSEADRGADETRPTTSRHQAQQLESIRVAQDN